MADTVEKKNKKSTPMVHRFLEEARDGHTPLSVYLLSGFQLKGEVVEFDDAAILFKHKGVHQLVMRPAVANIYPFRNSKGDAEEWWRQYAPAASGGKSETRRSKSASA